MKNIKTSSTKKILFANSGLILLSSMLKVSNISFKTKDCIPTLKSGFLCNFLKLKHLILAFRTGVQCLDYMTVLVKDSAFMSVCEGKVYSAKAYGDLLRSFSYLQCKELNYKLTESSYQLRLEL